MRIHLSLDPKHLVQGVAGPFAGPLVNIGGDLVLVELQGELNHEGDKEGGVVGILGLDRPVSIPHTWHDLADVRINRRSTWVNIIYSTAKWQISLNHMLSFAVP